MSLFLYPSSIIWLRVGRLAKWEGGEHFPVHYSRFNEGCTIYLSFLRFFHSRIKINRMQTKTVANLQ